MDAVTLAALLLAGSGLVSYGGGKPASEVTPAEFVAGSRRRQGGVAAVRGKKIVLPAAAVTSLRQFGDDYLESGLLLLDVDTPADGRPDVATDIRPSQV